MLWVWRTDSHLGTSVQTRVDHPALRPALCSAGAHPEPLREAEPRGPRSPRSLRGRSRSLQPPPLCCACRRGPALLDGPRSGCTGPSHQAEAPVGLCCSIYSHVSLNHVHCHRQSPYSGNPRQEQGCGRGRKHFFEYKKFLISFTPQSLVLNYYEQLHPVLPFPILCPPAISRPLKEGPWSICHFIFPEQRGSCPGVTL